MTSLFLRASKGNEFKSDPFIDSKLGFNPKSQAADVCLILEGTYPYVAGGVASWSHDLIQKQSHLNFHLLCILPPYSRPKRVFELPENVVGLTNVYLQELPLGVHSIKNAKTIKLFDDIELPLLKLQHFGRLNDFKAIISALDQFEYPLGKAILLESSEAWNMTLHMYRMAMGESSFLNFYFSWKGLMSSFYSVLLAPLPKARIYHAVSTGYAGLFLARAHLKTHCPCLITEHGIYTNERRIEIALADWLYDQKTMNLSLNQREYTRDLKDFWIDTFYGYSKLAYDAAEKIITLYQGNQEYQIADGADPKKMCIIPNGVDIDIYQNISRSKTHPPTMALIGRVVPIKDVKSFIHAAGIVKQKYPDLIAYVLGPVDEDPEYYQECLDLASHLALRDTVIFTGKVKITDFFPKIDIVVLTSISESQPLAILEAGAAGIPCVTTDAGCCPELIYGQMDEDPRLGPAGMVVPPASPSAIAESVLLLFEDSLFYQSCSQSIQKRMSKYYDSSTSEKEYHDLYRELINRQTSSKVGER